MAIPMLDSTPLPVVYGEQGVRLAPPVLNENIRCDTVVIGAGVTGTSTAYHLAASGRDVVLLEEGKIGSGGSGRAFGNVVSVGKHSDTWVRKRYGIQGEQILDWLSSGPDLVFGLIEEHHIDCMARRAGLLFPAHFDGIVPTLKAQAETLAARGQKVSYLDEDETADIIGSKFYCGALLDRSAGSINPLAYTRGLADAARKAGAAIYQETTATRLVKTAGSWTVSTVRGTVTAHSIVICTNAYSGNLWPRLGESILPIRGYAVVSKPLDHNLRGNILPQGQSLTDTRRTWSGIRLLDDGRLHLSVMGPSFNPNGEADIIWANKRVKDVFPTLPPTEWDGSWSGWVALNIAQEPKLHQLDDTAWAAVGYSGRGLAFGTLMGRDIAFRLSDREREATFPTSPLRPIIGRHFAPFVVELVLNYYAWLDERELNQRRRTLTKHTLEAD